MLRPSFRPLLAGLLLALAGAARAQIPDPASFATLFPPDPVLPGTAPGVAVRSRARPEYAPRGVPLGLIMAHPSLDLGIGYDTDPAGQGRGPGSLVVSTAPSLSLGAAWEQDRAGLVLGAEDRRYPALPALGRTDWTAAAGIALGFGRDRLRLRASERALHEDGDTIGALPTDHPLPYRVSAALASYRFAAARLSITPEIGVASWRYGAASLGGVAISERDRDRDIGRAGVTARYALDPGLGFVIVLRDTATRYVAPAPGAPSRNSDAIAALAGLEDAADPMLRLRLLVGYERRAFAAAAYGIHQSPIAEAQAIWQPDGMTTVTATLSRRIEDAAAEGVSGYAETALALRLDREARRNLIVSLALGGAHAEFTGGAGREQAGHLGASATWLLNRRMRLTAGETLTTLDAAGGGAPGGARSATNSLSLLSLGFGL
ncbi:MAG: outer membrane beta-barrel protein [Rhodospirillales bacterium]|nr:outer membrane beta-barrel protein [Rhodospirillales bacterium]